jgi:hypothetical protein
MIKDNTIQEEAAMRYILVSFTLLIVFSSLTSMYGAEHFGIQVYAGAQLDKEETAFLRKNISPDGFFYRTRDSVEKVTAFYNKHRGLTSLGGDTNAARFITEENGRTVYINIDSPWQPTKGGEVSRDTRIVIIKE